MSAAMPTMQATWLCPHPHPHPHPRGSRVSLGLHEGSRLERLAELDEHRDDAVEELLAAMVCLLRDEVSTATDVEHGGGLRGGSDGGRVVAPLVSSGEFSRSFGDVVHDREGSTRELVGEVSSAAAVAQML